MRPAAAGIDRQRRRRGEPAGQRSFSDDFRFFSVTASTNFNIQVNGNLPNLTAVNGVPQGDQLDAFFPGSINIFSDDATPPNVTITGQTANGGSPFGVKYSSIERVNLNPGNGIVNIIGDNDVAGKAQNDYYKVRGGIDPLGSITPPDRQRPPPCCHQRHEPVLPPDRRKLAPGGRRRGEPRLGTSDPGGRTEQQDILLRRQRASMPAAALSRASTRTATPCPTAPTPPALTPWTSPPTPTTLPRAGASRPTGTRATPWPTPACRTPTPIC